MSAEAPPEPEPNGRRYRSKKQRPCDVCRSRKIQCKLQGNEAVCEMCKKLGRRCTYVLGPLTRKYRGCATGDNTSRPDTVPLPAGSEQQQQQQQEDLARSDIPMQNTGDPQSMDVDPFWLPPDLRWSPRAFSNLLAVDWSAVEFPLGRIPTYMKKKTMGKRSMLTMSQEQVRLIAADTSRPLEPTTMAHPSRMLPHQPTTSALTPTLAALHIPC